MSKERKLNEQGRQEVAEIIQRMCGVPAEQTVEILRFLSPAVVELLANQQKAGIEAPRVELRGFGIAKGKQLKAKTISYHNIHTGKKEEKELPERFQVSFSVSPMMKKSANDALDLGA